MTLISQLAPAAPEPVLQLQGIVKTFAGTPALSGVDLTLHAGQVHALVGENGAGKSTLIKILTGAYRRDGGTIRLHGCPVEFRSPQQAQAQGIVAVYQEVSLLLSLSVAENIYLGREPRRWGLIHWRKLNDAAKAVLSQLGLNIQPQWQLGSLTLALRQMVAIARGVSLGARVVILDEPTSSLTTEEVALLYRVIRQLRADGVAVLYISHRLDELYALGDRVTVLRDGKVVGSGPLAQIDRLKLVCLMLGKDRNAQSQGGHSHGYGHGPGLTAAPPAQSDAAQTTAEPLLRAKHLASGHRLLDASVAVGRGEIVGVAGLLGSGRTELLRALFGLDRLDAGTVQLRGRAVVLRSPRDAIDAGLALLSEDRQREGIIPELSVRENLTLAVLPRLTRLGIVSRTRQRAIVDRFIQRLHIKVASADQNIRELSGGNQQKVLLARWLCLGPWVLLLDEPTRGIDVGAKAELQALIQELCTAGLGVLMVSSELDELVAASTRVLVLRNGRGVAELPGAAITQPAILHAMAEGHAAPQLGADEGG